jgi:hypothetical protein
MLEEYPSLAEGVGLENREAPQGARGFESLLLRHRVYQLFLSIIAGWSNEPKLHRISYELPRRIKLL